MTTIQGRLLFEGGYYLRRLLLGSYYSRRLLFEDGYYLRVATIRGWLLFEGGYYLLHHYYFFGGWSENESRLWLDYRTVKVGWWALTLDNMVELIRLKCLITTVL